MNPASYRLSKEILQEMIDNDDEKVFRKYESIYDTSIKGPSPAERNQQVIDEIFTKHLSEPLKKLHIEYLQSVTKKCYQDRHLSEDFTNFEQILLCKELEHQKYFGKFDRAYNGIRDSSKFDCSELFSCLQISRLSKCSQQ